MKATRKRSPAPTAASGPEPETGLSAVPAPKGTGWLEAGWALLDADRRVVSIDDALAQWFEASVTALTGKVIDDLLLARHPHWGEDLTELWKAAPFARRQFQAGTNSEARWVDLEVARNGSGWMLRVGSVLPPHQVLAESAWNEHLRRPEEQRQLFMRVVRAEAQLDNLLRRWPGVIFHQRADFSFQYASPKIEELTGVSVETWQQQPQRFWQIVHEADAEEVRQQCKRAASGRQPVTTTYRIRHARTGQIAYLLEYREAIVSQSGLVLSYEGVWQDVTRETIAEKRLSSAAWKETLATLTMGLAHDFSNIMSGILSLSELFLAQLEPGHPFIEGLSLIKQNSMQASQLVHRIINLHRGQTGERQYHDLNQLVPEVVDLVKKILPRRIQISVELAPESLPLYLDAVEFRQVIINLALNAADAMPNRGALCFRTSLHLESRELPNGKGKFPRLPCICLSVQDNGCGIAPQHLPLIFDPFFTTKPVNKGSGLGLYNARLFVDKHYGAISVESAENQGTTFSLWLPQADFTETEQVPEAEPAKRLQLLLVSDIPSLRDSTAEFLRASNYYVATAPNPARARELLASGENHFAGVLLIAAVRDQGMLGLLNDLSQRKPPVKTVFQMVGGGEFDESLAARPGLMITSDLSEAQFLDKLNHFFNDVRNA